MHAFCVQSCVVFECFVVPIGMRECPAIVMSMLSVPQFQQANDRKQTAHKLQANAICLLKT